MKDQMMRMLLPITIINRISFMVFVIDVCPHRPTQFLTVKKKYLQETSLTSYASTQLCTWIRGQERQMPKDIADGYKKHILLPYYKSNDNHFSYRNDTCQSKIDITISSL